MHGEKLKSYSLTFTPVIFHTYFSARRFFPLSNLRFYWIMVFSHSPFPCFHSSLKTSKNSFRNLKNQVNMKVIKVWSDLKSLFHFLTWIVKSKLKGYWLNYQGAYEYWNFSPTPPSLGIWTFEGWLVHLLPLRAKSHSNALSLSAQVRRSPWGEIFSF